MLGIFSAALAVVNKLLELQISGELIDKNILAVSNEPVELHDGIPRETWYFKKLLLQKVVAARLK